MKLAFIFLMAMVAASFEQQQSSYFIPIWSEPLFYPVGVSNNIFHPFLQAVKAEPNDIEADDGQELTQSRAVNRRGNYPPSRPKPIRAYFDSVITNPYLVRPFNMFNPFMFPFTPAYRTSVVTTSVTSTIIAASIVTCIPSSQFSPNGTNLQCRRRREIAEILDLITDETYASIEPTAVQQMETTLAPYGWQNLRQPWQTDIVSSKEDMMLAQARPLWSRNYITYTSTSIFYIFNSTVIQKRVVPVANPSQLTCIPPGFVVCAN